MKNSLFDSLFTSESSVFSPFLEKMHFMAFYTGKIGVQGSSQAMWDSFHTNLCVKNFHFIVFGILDA